MKRITKKSFLAFYALTFAISFLQASSFEEQKKGEMIKELEVIKHHLEAGYAPMEWKKESLSFDLNTAFDEAKYKILKKTSISTKDFQQIVRSFVNSLRDYHVGITFFSTESASLPFSVKTVDGRYFIDWVDPIRLPSSYYGLCLGDELLEFDQRPVNEVIRELQSHCSISSNELTDLSYVAMNLTMRKGAAGDVVPQGNVLVTTCSKETGRIATRQIRWSYTPERIHNPFDLLMSLDFLKPFIQKTINDSKINLCQFKMMNPVHAIYGDISLDRNGGFGSRKSFLPFLGEVIWNTDKEEGEKAVSSSNSSFLHAYIFRSKEKQIGYIRIPHYLISEPDVKEFGKILTEMEKNTDALVIDQLHNFGGFVHIQYALISMLTDKPMDAPYHRIKLSQKEVMRAIQTLEIIDFFEHHLQVSSKWNLTSDDQRDDNKDSPSKDNKDNEDNEDEDEVGAPFQELLFLKAFCEQIITDWNAGRVLSLPTPISGVDKINPHAKYNYSKPILMLIDEMDFSGGDFVPAILQDNQRALLFGTKTAGAGGYIAQFEFPNLHGIDTCTFTASIAERKDLQKIENVGVSPDIDYQITIDDIQNGYVGYIEAVNKAVATFFPDDQTVNPKQESSLLLPKEIIKDLENQFFEE